MKRFGLLVPYEYTILFNQVLSHIKCLEAVGHSISVSVEIEIKARTFNGDTYAFGDCCLRQGLQDGDGAVSAALEVSRPIFVVLKSVTQTRFTGRIMYSGCVLHFDAGYI